MIRMTRWSVSIQSSLTPLYGTLLDSESINLMRMSPLSKFSGFIEQLVSRMEGATGDIQFQGNVSETKIAGPTLQVIPIGIFA